MASAAIRLSDDALLALQRAGAAHIGISLTRACPLSCAHCAAATVPAAQHRTAGLSSALVDRFCAEMPELARRGIRSLSLTGGEPVLALDHVARLSAAARAAGIRTTLVTGLYWARSAAGRERVVGRLADIDTWDLSWDRFHAAEVPFDALALALERIRAAGAQAVVRIAVSDPETEADREIERLVAGRLAPVAYVKQPVRPVGRAGGEAALQAAAGGEPAPAWPCLSTGPLVMPDGSARPCCSSMIDEPGHPFRARTAADGLVALHRDWSGDPVMLMLRAIGFAPVLRLLARIAPGHPLAAGTGRHPCDTCAAIFGDPALGPAIAAELRREPLAGLARQAAAALFSDPAAPPQEDEHAHD